MKAFRFEVTRIERYIVACYDAEDGGYFRPHRDNLTSGTAHRQFACSINLNAEEFEGGDLRFPEYGARTYRPPTGGAVVFSCSLLHEATPVTRGTRYAFLPFLYDEAGEKIRRQNLHLIELPTTRPLRRPTRRKLTAPRIRPKPSWRAPWGAARARFKLPRRAPRETQQILQRKASYLGVTP